MPLPVTKQELADWILRRLGAPVVNVELTDVQLEDSIDEAVQFFQWYHYDGAERTYRVIKVGSECVKGQERMHQALCAPMYDITKEWRIGDRAMTYKANGTPDKIAQQVRSMINHTVVQPAERALYILVIVFLYSF